MTPARRLDSPISDPRESRLDALRRATARRQKLENLYADAAYLDRVMADGRWLKLCSAIAWASECEERARQAVNTDLMVSRLRDVASGTHSYRS